MHARGACVITAFALSVAACGGSSKSGANGASGTTVPSKPCPGAPLKFTSIIALSGPLGTGGDRSRTGIDAAVDGVNRTCALGRPLQVTICDDKDDTNANLACGRKAGSDGSLAILGSIGSFDDGVTASKLPAIFVNGTSPFELTNKNAYSSVNGIALGISGTSAIKARGRKSSTLRAPGHADPSVRRPAAREDGGAAEGQGRPDLLPAGHDRLRAGRGADLAGQRRGGRHAAAQSRRRGERARAGGHHAREPRHGRARRRHHARDR